jgi:folate-dependent phosphoribosylglycinamide formyltransferase PurN
MKVLFVTQEEPFFIPRYMEKVIEKQGHITCGIISLPAFSSFRKMLRYNFCFFGPLVFFYMAMKFIVCKCIDFLSFIVPVKRYYSVKRVAKRFKIPYYSLARINDDSAFAVITSHKPDILFSIAAPQKFDKKVLDSPSYGCFNIHSSLLPKYRGCNALFWALLHDEHTTGVTIHKMDDELDTGPTAYQKEITIDSDETVFSLYEKAIDAGSEAIDVFFSRIARGGKNIPLKESPDSGDSLYFSFPQAQDRKLLYKKGRRFTRFL